MEKTKNIIKIIIHYTSCYGDGSILTITETSISCKDISTNSNLDDWSFQSNSYKFRWIFSKITELIQNHLEPTSEKDQADQYEFSITYDDNTNFIIKHSTSYIMFEDLFCEIHKLIPSFEEIPMGFDTDETYSKRVEDLDGDMVNKVSREELEGYDID